jgi:nicotinamidase-related amidase
MVVEVVTRPPLTRRPQATVEPFRGAWSADAVVEPFGWDGFHGTPLDAQLRAAGREHLLFAGWWLETAVHSTMRSANDRGYECLLATDLVVGLDPTTTAGAISSIHMSGGIFGATGSGLAAVTALCAAPPPLQAKAPLPANLPEMESLS